VPFGPEHSRLDHEVHVVGNELLAQFQHPGDILLDYAGVELYYPDYILFHRTELFCCLDWNLHARGIKPLVYAVTPGFYELLLFQGHEMVGKGAVVQTELLFDVVVVITGILNDVLEYPAPREMVEDPVGKIENPISVDTCELTKDSPRASHSPHR